MEMFLDLIFAEISLLGHIFKGNISKPGYFFPLNVQRPCFGHGLAPFVRPKCCELLMWPIYNIYFYKQKEVYFSFFLDWVHWCPALSENESYILSSQAYLVLKYRFCQAQPIVSSSWLRLAFFPAFPHPATHPPSHPPPNPFSQFMEARILKFGGCLVGV